MATTFRTIDREKAPARYGPVRAALHWTLAVAIIAMLAFGFFVIARTPEDAPAKVAMVRTHMIVGLAITAVLLIAIPLAYRRRQPPPLPTGSASLDLLSKAVHHALRLIVAATVISGIATAAGAGVPAVVFSGVADRLPAATTASVAFRFHALLALSLALLVALHVAGALFHAIVKRDDIFARMSLGRRS
jgi:cytochrome b561